MGVYQFGNSDLKVKIENIGGVQVYIGEAKPGTAVAAAKWRIKKLVYDGSNLLTDVQWADGTADFVKVWDDRSLYSYS